MNLHYKMSAQEWKYLLDYLTAQGCKLISYPETDNEGFFVDFRYVTVEYNGIYFYMDDVTDWGFSVVKYMKVSPYEKQQAGYPYAPASAKELMEYIRNQIITHIISGTYKQRIFLTELYGMRDGYTNLWHLKYKLAGNRERAILDSLDLITMQRNTKDYCVLRFHGTNGDWFDYETKSRRITG